MPDSAAAPVTPLAVLVLAWDETVPAVRTLIEAAPALGQLLVLMPPAAVASPAGAPILPSPELPQPAEAAASILPPAFPADFQADTAAATPSPAALLNLPSWPLPAAATPAVRLLRLVAASPAELAAKTEPPRPAERSAPMQWPAAPYLGATPGPAQTAGGLLTEAWPAVAEAAHQVPAVEVAAPASPVTAPIATAVSDAPVAFATETPLGAEPEADDLPDPASLPASTASSAELARRTAAAETLPLAGPLPVSYKPTFSPPALATSAPNAVGLPEPLEPELPEAASAEAEPLAEVEPAAATHAELVVQRYSAPNLNSQVIRYARLAVPVALAEAPFGAIYAPAWPTWLAALELRQRHPAPLVLHLHALAAGRQPADTAAGWPAELQRQVLRQADLVLVETYSLARRLRRELGLAATSVRVASATDTAAVARALRRARRRTGPA